MLKSLKEFPIKNFLTKYREEFFLATVLIVGTALWTYRPANYLFQSSCDFEKASEQWTYDSSGLNSEFALSGNNAFKFDTSREFGPTFTAEINKIGLQAGDEIEAGCFGFLLTYTANPLLVISITKPNAEVIAWDRMMFRRHIAKIRSWQQVFFSIQLPDFRKEDSLLFNAYIWNKDKADFLVEDLTVKVKRQSPKALLKRD